ncbi:MAG: hypothetical protein HN348_06150, partial [Proteobacteria bacterium]|nr:hypothetical protein [Pseudomonadota bacterium]
LGVEGALYRYEGLDRVGGWVSEVRLDQGLRLTLSDRTGLAIGSRLAAGTDRIRKLWFLGGLSLRGELLERR